MLANNSTTVTLFDQVLDRRWPRISHNCQRGNGSNHGRPFYLFDLLKREPREIDMKVTLDGIIKWLNTAGYTTQSSIQIATESPRNIYGLAHRIRKRGGEGCAKQGKGKVNQNTKRQEGRVSKNQTPRKRKRCNKQSKKTDTESQSSHVELPEDLRAAVRKRCLLACPFAKHNPERYTLVHNACTERFGFPSPGKVVEHLKRVHSLSHPCCTKCKKRFNRNNMKENQQSLEDHRKANDCKSRSLTISDPEWMTVQQEGLFSDSIISSPTQSSEEKWQSIYCFLFPDADKDCLPDAHYDFLLPRHLTAESTLTQPHLNAAEIDQNPTPTLVQGNYDRRTENRPAHSETERFHNQSGSTVLPAPSSVPASAMLTAEVLTINEMAQPSSGFQYGVHQGRDSGYESLVAGMEPSGSPEMVMKAVPEVGGDNNVNNLGAPLDAVEVCNADDRRQDLLGLEYGHPEWPNDPYGFDDELFKLLQS